MTTQNGNPAGRQSVSSHPTFPLLVALWFGALLGLGSLAVRPALLEQLVLDLGIDTVIAAAAPPLGTTFRILLALSMATLGAIIGAVVAHRLRRAPRPTSDLNPRRARDAHPDAPPRRPISAREEFNEDDAVTVEADDERQTLPGRRRALAIADVGPSEFHELAPLPGGNSHGFDATARLDALVEKLGPSEDRRRSEPVEREPETEPAEYDQSGTSGAFAPPQDAVRENNDDLPFGRPPAIAEPPFAEPMLEEPTLEEPSEGEPASRDCLAKDGPPKPASAAERLIGRPLERLSIPELSERLAIALEQRRLRQAQAASAHEAAASAEGQLVPASKDSEPAPLSQAAVPVEQQRSAVPSSYIPAPLRPIDLDFLDEAEDGLDESTLADGYSSLLDLSRPAPLRSGSAADGDDGEPVVTFPGQEVRRAAASSADAEAPTPMTASAAAAALRRFDAPTGGNIPANPASLTSAPALDREEADRALRAALATLQRMSGAA